MPINNSRVLLYPKGHFFNHHSISVLLRGMKATISLSMRFVFKSKINTEDEITKRNESTIVFVISRRLFHLVTVFRESPIFELQVD